MRKIEKIENDIKQVKERKDFRRGHLKAMDDYLKSHRDYETEFFVNTHTLFNEEFEDYVNYLKESGIQYFIVINESTNLLEWLHYIFNNKGHIIDAVEVEHKRQSEWEPIWKSKGLMIKLI